jgi:hypothetical protein
MRLRGIGLLVGVLVCSFSAAAQTVVEAGSSFSVDNRAAIVKLAVTSDSENLRVPTSV